MIPNIQHIFCLKISNAYKYDPRHATDPFGENPDTLIHITVVIPLGRRTIVVSQLQYGYHHCATQTPKQGLSCKLHNISTPFEAPTLVEHIVKLDKASASFVASKAWVQLSFWGRKHRVVRQLPLRRPVTSGN